MSIDKRNQHLYFKIWDVNKQFEADTKVVGSNLGPHIIFFIDNNRTISLHLLVQNQSDAGRVN